MIQEKAKIKLWREQQAVQNSQINAANVTLHLQRQVIWGDIWIYTVEKSLTNATNVILHPLGQAIWGNIWRNTVVKRKTNVTNVEKKEYMKRIYTCQPQYFTWCDWFGLFLTVDYEPEPALEIVSWTQPTSQRGARDVITSIRESSRSLGKYILEHIWGADEDDSDESDKIPNDNLIFGRSAMVGPFHNGLRFG